jgi:hypothetical protein
MILYLLGIWQILDGLKNGQRDTMIRIHRTSRIFGSILFSTSKITGFSKNIMGEAMCMSSGQRVKALCPQKYIIEVWYSARYILAAESSGSLTSRIQTSIQQEKGM